MGTEANLAVRTYPHADRRSERGQGVGRVRTTEGQQVSIEAHPNLHAVGLQISIFKAMRSCLRGPAAEHEAQSEHVILSVSDHILELVVELSIKLDAEFREERPPDA